MPLVFRTNDDHTSDVELVGIGVLRAQGQGGIPVAEAAARGMSELQRTQPDGSFAYDGDGQLVPLEGARLGAAAKRYTEAHPYLQLDNVKEANLAGLADEGRPVQAYPTPAEAAEQAYAYAYGGDEAPAAAAPEADAAGDDDSSGGAPAQPATGGDQ